MVFAQWPAVQHNAILLIMHVHTLSSLQANVLKWGTVVVYFCKNHVDKQWLAAGSIPDLAKLFGACFLL